MDMWGNGLPEEFKDKEFTMDMNINGQVCKISMKPTATGLQMNISGEGCKYLQK